MTWIPVPPFYIPDDIPLPVPPIPQPGDIIPSPKKIENDMTKIALLAGGAILLVLVLKK